jgi:hypothetical protein
MRGKRLFVQRNNHYPTQGYKRVASREIHCSQSIYHKNFSLGAWGSKQDFTSLRHWDLLRGVSLSRFTTLSIISSIIIKLISISSLESDFQFPIHQIQVSGLIKRLQGVEVWCVWFDLCGKMFSLNSFKMGSSLQIFANL